MRWWCLAPSALAGWELRLGAATLGTSTPLLSPMIAPEETTEGVSDVPAPTAPEGITSMDLYKELDELIGQNRVPPDIVKQILSDERYADMFAGFKRSDQLVVRPFDLNDEARLVLLKLIRGIASSD